MSLFIVRFEIQVGEIIQCATDVFWVNEFSVTETANMRDERTRAWPSYDQLSRISTSENNFIRKPTIIGFIFYELTYCSMNMHWMLSQRSSQNVAKHITWLLHVAGMQNCVGYTSHFITTVSNITLFNSILT
jgi:hypothetical protein